MEEKERGLVAAAPCRFTVLTAGGARDRLRPKPSATAARRPPHSPQYGGLASAFEFGAAPPRSAATAWVGDGLPHSRLRPAGPGSLT